MQLNNLRETEILKIVEALKGVGSVRLAGNIQDQFERQKHDEKQSALDEYLAHRASGISGNMCL